MRSRTPLVHPRAGHVAILLPRKQCREQTIEVGNDGLGGIDEHTPPRILPDGQDVGAVIGIARRAASVDHEVPHLLVVDLDEGHTDQKDARGRVGGDVPKDVLGGHVEDAAVVTTSARTRSRGRAIVDAAGPLHGVRLARTGLAVRKDRAIQTRHDAPHDISCRVDIHIARAGLFAKHLIEREEVAILDPFRQGLAGGSGLGDGVVLLQGPPDPPAGIGGGGGGGGGFAGVERPHTDGDWISSAQTARR